MYKNQLKLKGFYKTPSLVDEKSCVLLFNQMTKHLKKPKSLIKGINFKYKKKFNHKYPSVRQNKFFLNQADYQKGLKFFSKHTNSVQIKDPLLKFNELNKYIFSQKIYSVLRNYFKDENFYFLYAAIRIHFKNNLPQMDYNFFHLDKTYNSSNKEKNIIKFWIPFSLEKGKKIDCSEFNIISVNKKKISKDLIIKTDYSIKKKLPLSLKKKINTPDIKTGDCLFFDPVNFFHNANKPNNLRVVFYGVAGRKENYIAKKSKFIKISKKEIKKFNGKIQKYTSLISKV